MVRPQLVLALLAQLYYSAFTAAAVTNAVTNAVTIAVTTGNATADTKSVTTDATKNMVDNAAEQIDWSLIPSSNVITFYPGVSSWDFMRNKDHGSGAAMVKKKKKACVDCHIDHLGKFDFDEEKIIGNELKKLKNKPSLQSDQNRPVSGFKDVGLQVVYDNTFIYMRFTWQDTSPKAIASAGESPAILSVQFNGNSKAFRLYGCFVACHDDQKGMPQDTGEDLRLYAFYARKKGQLQPQAELESFLAKDQFIDLWIASLNDANVTTRDQYILHDRQDDKNDLGATATFINGEYTVVLTRKLSTGDGKDLDFRMGSTMNLGIAIHPSGRANAQHYTSLPFSLGLSTKADIVAQKYKSEKTGGKFWR